MPPLAQFQSILWFRLDLRLADNPALQAARKSGARIVPLFIWAPNEESPWQPGAASRWWLHQSLTALDNDLRALGSRLVIRQGRSLDCLRAVVNETGARAVFWNRRYEPILAARDRQIQDALRSDGLEIQTFAGALLHEPETIRNQSGKPFQVFTPFWRHCLDHSEPADPLPAPTSFPAPRVWPYSLRREALELEPKVDWAQGLVAAWQPGAAGARVRLRRFLKRGAENYSRDRDEPGITGTSRLSPHLHFGEITPRQVWHGLRRYAQERNLPAATWQRSRFLTELGWREFSHHLLHHFPHTPDKPLRPAFERFPWRKNQGFLRAWQQGQTGYPLVDAGMRELWATGWMHNRVRMIVASFLVKDLLTSWQEGILWSTRTWLRTRWAGNGPPAAAPMPRPTSASSIP
jgi:deoxyribodipyrimidine photo-lyase